MLNSDEVQSLEHPLLMHWRTFEAIGDMADDVQADINAAFFEGARRIVGW